QKGTVDEQRANVEATATQLAQLVEEGYELVLTHGNGPQVGNLLIQNEEAADSVPPMPLDVLGAQSQGMIGYIFQQSLGNELVRRGIRRPVVSVVTQIEVDGDDPGFQDPTKPVGPFFTEERADQLMKLKGYIMKPQDNKGWRRVVASPAPLRIVERTVVEQLLGQGAIVISGGGGGIPVLREADGQHRGVEAVIDKDLAGCLLALDLEADGFMILTDVSHVKLHFGTPQEKSLGEVDVDTMDRFIEEGHFGEGSMGPKVAAAVRFARSRQKTSYVTSLSEALQSLAGREGTRVVPVSAASSR
ncbi:MAG: carbamate kinase, partial [Thermaerobacterales bacterium]